MKLRDLQNEYLAKLSDLYGPEEIRAIFAALVMHNLGMRRPAYLMALNQPADPELVAYCSEALIRLSGGCPLQHLTGEAHFYGLDFAVSPDVLIPRPETEELVAWAENTVRQMPAGERLTVMDFCTGSGCIAITLKHAFPHADVSALDLSAAALAVAASNARRHQTDIQLIAADVCQYKPDQQFDLIISNPPYIPETDRTTMHQNVLEHEPAMALFVPDHDPLIFYRVIAQIAAANLKAGGFLFFEIYPVFAIQMRELLADLGFQDIQIIKDMHGKDRMLRASVI